MNVLKKNVNFLMFVFLAVILGTVSCDKDDDKDFDPNGTYSGTIIDNSGYSSNFSATVENSTITFTAAEYMGTDIVGTLDNSNVFVATGIEDDGTYIIVTLTLTGTIDQAGKISGTYAGSDYLYSEDKTYEYSPGTFSGQKQ